MRKKQLLWLKKFFGRRPVLLIMYSAFVEFLRNTGVKFGSVSAIRVFKKAYNSVRRAVLQNTVGEFGYRYGAGWVNKNVFKGAYRLVREGKQTCLTLFLLRMI